MFKIGKVGGAIVMSLLLAMAILVSGAFAQETTTTHNATSASTRTATLAGTGDVLQGTQQMLPVSRVQSPRANQSGYWCRGPYCRHYRHYRRHGGVRCYWVRRGWRTVRVCNRW